MKRAILFEDEHLKCLNKIFNDVDNVNYLQYLLLPIVNGIKLYKPLNIHGYLVYPGMINENTSLRIREYDVRALPKNVEKYAKFCPRAKDRKTNELKFGFVVGTCCCYVYENFFKVCQKNAEFLLTIFFSLKPLYVVTHGTNQKKNRKTR